MNDGGVVVHYLFNLDRGLCDFSTAAASVVIRATAIIGVNVTLLGGEHDILFRCRLYIS